MRAPPRVALVALAAGMLLATAPARAEPHLVIVVSGTGHLPIEKITEALRAELPGIAFSIGTVPDARQGAASGRLVRWADGRVAVGFRDALGREDVRVVDPGPEPATAIASALAELRAALLAEPVVEPEIDLEEWPQELDAGPRVRHARPSTSPPAARSSLPIGRVSLSMGFGSGGLRVREWTPVEPYGLLGADLAFFPGALHGLEGLASWLGIVVGLHARGGSPSYSSQDFDAAFALQRPFTSAGDDWFRLRAGYRWFGQSLAAGTGRTSDEPAITRIGYGGALAGVESVFPISSETAFTVGLTVHAVSTVYGPAAADAEPAASGFGWTGRVGCGGRGPLAWSLDLELARYEVDLGEQDVAQTNLQAVVGVGWGL